MDSVKESLDLLGLGYCGQDFSCLVDRIPVDAKAEALSCRIGGGGPAATATFTAARLGLRTGFVGVVGGDLRGRQIMEELRDAGVLVDQMLVRENAESPAAFCWAEKETGQRSVIWTRGTADPLQAQEVSPRAVGITRLLHLDGHHTYAAIRTAEIAREQGVIVSLDAGTLLPGIEGLLPLCDIVIASEKFAQAFTDLEDPVAAARKLLPKNGRFGGVTLGPRGSVGFDGNRIFVQPAFPGGVVDSTGAGDVFHGAFAVRLLDGADWQECLRFASAVAALKCRKLGGRAGIPTRVETDQFLEKKL